MFLYQKGGDRVKVKCIKEYYDKTQEVYIKKDTIYEVEKNRAKVLISHDVVCEMKEQPEENKGNTGACK